MKKTDFYPEFKIYICCKSIQRPSNVYTIQVTVRTIIVQTFLNRKTRANNHQSFNVTYTQTHLFQKMGTRPLLFIIAIIIYSSLLHSHQQMLNTLFL